MQVMVTNVTSLLKTVKAVEDEATRGTRALEATIEYMKQELTVRSQQSPPLGTHVQQLTPAQASLRLLVQRGFTWSTSIQGDHSPAGLQSHCVTDHPGVWLGSIYNCNEGVH